MNCAPGFALALRRRCRRSPSRTPPGSRPRPVVSRRMPGRVIRAPRHNTARLPGGRRPAPAAPQALTRCCIRPCSSFSSDSMKMSSRFRRCCCRSFRCCRSRFWFWACRFATGLPLPSPLHGLVPSGGHPSRLRPLRGLRVPCPAARFAHRRLPLRHRRATRRHPGSPATAIAARFRLACPCRLRRPWAAPRLAGVRLREPRPARSRAEPRPLSRRRGCPSVPIPAPFSPTFGTLDRVFSTPFGGLALTPNAACCRCRHMRS